VLRQSIFRMTNGMYPEVSLCILWIYKSAVLGLNLSVIDTLN
jgi:hypothetical protein